MSRLTVALIFGGNSSEHVISVISARAVAAQISQERYELAPVYIDRSGNWHGAPCAAEVLATDLAALLRGGDPEAASRKLAEIAASDAVRQFDFNAFRHRADVAFLVLHGSYGEDGRIQGMLETLGLPYTGCGVTASAVAMDKALTKLSAEAAGVAVAGGLTFLSSDYFRDPAKVCDSVAASCAWPVFVKPASLGSSVGISKVHNASELPPALDRACALDAKVLVETSVSGREIEVAVLGNDDPIASVPGEIVPGSEFYDFEDKYIKNAAKLFIPARLDDDQSDAIRAAALKVFRALGCRGLSRIDFFLEDGTGRIILNEVNTIPGFTDVSMYPMLMAASGIDFPQLVERLLQLALESAHASADR